MVENLDLEVLRYNPEIDKEPRLVAYKVPFEEGMSVLMALEIVSKQHELAFRCSCNIGYCSICMVRINGKDRLPCKTIVKDPKEKIRVEPRKGFPVIRDLVVDFQK